MTTEEALESIGQEFIDNAEETLYVSYPLSPCSTLFMCANVGDYPVGRRIKSFHCSCYLLLVVCYNMTEKLAIRQMNYATTILITYLFLHGQEQL